VSTATSRKIRTRTPQTGDRAQRVAALATVRTETASGDTSRTAELHQSLPGIRFSVGRGSVTLSLYSLIESRVLAAAFHAFASRAGQGPTLGTPAKKTVTAKAWMPRGCQKRREGAIPS
jgi:hypothetical protein